MKQNKSSIPHFLKTIISSKHIVEIFIFFLYFTSFAQYDNLLIAKDSTSLKPKTLAIGIDNMAFVKDNEYFNLIADGYTLLGNQTEVSFNYQAHQNYRLTAGFYALKYFGTNNFEPLIPYVGLEINKGHSRFNIGKLYTDDRHQLPDEIYAFERLLDARHIEHGLQHRFNNAHWQTDTWLEWEHFIQKADHRRERLNFGQSTTFKQRFKHWQFSIPLRIYLQHRGGQINVRDNGNSAVNNAVVFANSAVGIALENQLNNRTKIGFKYQYLRLDMNSNNPEELLFTSGYAHKWQIFVKYRHWQTYVSYWQSHQFVAPKGDDMFQSVSRRVEKYVDTQNQPADVFKYHAEPHRQLLTLSTRYQKEIFPDLNLAFIIDVYDQLNRSSIQSVYYNTEVYHQWDFTLGLYLRYRFDFNIIK